MSGGLRKNWWHRGRAELLLLIAIGLFLGAIGPFGTDIVAARLRFPYWLICMVGGGVIGIVADRLLQTHLPLPVPRTIAASIAMTPLVTLLVMATGHVLIWQSLGALAYLNLLWKVLVISVTAMMICMLVWRRAIPVIRTRTIIEAPLPEAEAAFRRRLSAGRRVARLIAVEAHDHYLRIHTNAGAELVTMRFSDALAELSQAHGYRVHRSWWIAAGAIENVRWRRGGGDARLEGGLVAPVSRSYTQVLRAAGWF